MPVIVRWFPPAWFQIKTRNQIIYIDPAYLRTYFTKYPQKIEFSKWPDPIDGLPEKLPPGDLILITHDHKDHCKDVTINRLRGDDTLICGPKRCIKKLGIDLMEVNPGAKLNFEGIKINVVDAYNTKKGSSTRKVHHKGDGVGYLLSIGGKKIYHAGDTDLIAEMKTLMHVDLAMLPIGGTFTMNIHEAVEAAIVIQPKVVIPMHRGKADPLDFKAKLEAQSAVKVANLSIGEIYELN
jgi:L-ascorbate metabolism protein UlaG (beta-lactamase superfamily)